MGHSYKLLYIFRPIVWMLVATLIVMFGNAFLKKMLNAIAIFLFSIGTIGGVYMISYFQKVLDPYYFATADEWSQCIVGSVTVICFLMCAVAYLMLGQTVDKENGKEVKHKKLKQNIASGLFAFVLPFAVMGYCLPFFILDSVAGIIVGIIGEIIGLLILFAIIRSFKKKKNQQEDKAEETEALEIEPGKRAEPVNTKTSEKIEKVEAKTGERTEIVEVKTGTKKDN